MRVALIKNNVVDNVALFDSIEKAQELYPDFVCIESNVAELGDAYNGSSFVKPVKRKKIISKFQFLSLFTVPESAAIYQKATTDFVVQAFLKKLEVSEHVDFNLPDLAAGLNYLKSVNCLTQARVDEILNG